MMPTELQAIPTTYRGVAFRSRLEARWSIFFDTLGIKWQYEPRKIHLNTGVNYIPDFHICRNEFWDEDQVPFWIEVKPNLDFVQPWKSFPFSRVTKWRGDALTVNGYFIADESFRLHLVCTRYTGEMWFDEFAIMRTKTGRTWLRRNKPAYGKALDIQHAVTAARTARFGLAENW